VVLPLLLLSLLIPVIVVLGLFVVLIGGVFSSVVYLSVGFLRLCFG